MIAENDRILYLEVDLYPNRWTPGRRVHEELTAGRWQRHDLCHLVDLGEYQARYSMSRAGVNALLKAHFAEMAGEAGPIADPGTGRVWVRIRDDLISITYTDAVGTALSYRQVAFAWN